MNIKKVVSLLERYPNLKFSSKSAHMHSQSASNLLLWMLVADSTKLQRKYRLIIKRAKDWEIDEEA